jgi:hypothetical protein
MPKVQPSGTTRYRDIWPGFSTAADGLAAVADAGARGSRAHPNIGSHSTHSPGPGLLMSCTASCRRDSRVGAGLLSGVSSCAACKGKGQADKGVYSQHVLGCQTRALQQLHLGLQATPRFEA